MKVHEIITEATMQDNVAKALPATYIIPKLQNQDPYKQYRFGMALAAARGAGQRQAEMDHTEMTESPWGENQIITTYDNEDSVIVDNALKAVGLSPKDKKLISSPKSEEPKNTGKHSPVATPKRNKYGI